MTWWWRVCRAAWTRWDEWRQQRRNVAADFDNFAWLEYMRRVNVSELGPRETPKRPGQRYVGKHRAIPNEPVRRPS